MTSTAQHPRDLILVVEDNVINQKVLIRMVEKLQFRSCCAANGRAGLESYLRHHDELAAVLMDCQMPVMDGFEATRRIRSSEDEPGRRRVPIVAVTANAMPGDRERCMSVGMDGFVPKPVSKATLEAALREVGALELRSDHEAA